MIPDPAVQAPADPHAALHAQAMQALAAVNDPELGESIVALGLVAALTLDDPAAAREARLVLIPTSSTCPMLDVLVDDAASALEAVLPADWSVRVVVDWETRWSPEHLAPALRARFGWARA